MSDLVGNPEDRFSRVEAHISIYYVSNLHKIYHIFKFSPFSLINDSV